MRYYNDNDPKTAEWLLALKEAGVIGTGTIDNRSIKDVVPADLAGFTRCHFFAGIAGWELALQLAGWPQDRPVWTGSCPCQPFSNAGKRQGDKDPRHLWPDFRNLIADCQPTTIFGEQVASKAGREWLAGVRADLEGLGYAVGAADLCAAGEGAPHIRQRLYWVAHSQHTESGLRNGQVGASEVRRNRPAINGSACGVANLQSNGRDEGRAKSDRRDARTSCNDGGMADVLSAGLEKRNGNGSVSPEETGTVQGQAIVMGGPWSEYQAIRCRDDKTRRIPIEPAFFPLADGLPGRVVQLRGLGNAIVPQVAATFITSFLECECESKTW